MHRRAAAALALLAVALGGASPAAWAEDAAVARRPPRVVVIVLDQFRADYLERFAPHFCDRGFKRLLREGAVYVNAHYRHATTYTGPGHATIATGGHAYQHGIVGNKWIDRATGREVYCAGDPEHRVSPRNLRSSTFGDELVLARPASKVVTVSVKDRGAIFLAGRLGRPYFWDPASGRFVTSTFYARELPGWARDWNEKNRLETALAGKMWKRALPEAAYAPLGPDDRPFEIDVPGLGRTFPHPLPAAPRDLYRAAMATPFGVQAMFDFVRAAWAAEDPDILCVSVSPIDYVGHLYGPTSHEALDMVAHVDRALASFLDALGDETVVILTADHGVALEPEAAARLGFEAGRIDPEELAKRADAALDAAKGARDWVLGFRNPGLYLAHSTPETQRIAAEALRAVPGVAYAFAHADLAAGRVPPHEIGRAVALSFEPSRSGDVVVVQAPYWFLDEDPRTEAATHSSPYDYDTHVPLILYGPGIKAGRHERRVSPADIAPTIARLLGTSNPSGCDGEPLVEALAK